MIWQCRNLELPFFFHDLIIDGGYLMGAASSTDGCAETEPQLASAAGVRDGDF